MKSAFTASDVTIVSVSYNSAEVLGEMLDSVPPLCPKVLVDNASDDIAQTAAIARKYGARLIECDQNAGFGAACNQGAARADTAFVMFLNPDARMLPGALDALLEDAARNPDAVAFNPRLVGPQGRMQFKRRSKLLPRKAWLGRGWPRISCDVPVLSGAALLVRRADFKAVGGFDEQLFLYHEDDDLSLRLAARGRLRFVREAGVVHAEGRSSARTPAMAAFKAYHMARSAVLAKRKHGGRFALLSTLFEGLAKLAALPALLSSRKRAQAIGFLKGALSVARRGKG